MCSSMMDDISTNFTVKEILSLAKNVTKYQISSTTGFPYNVTTMKLSNIGDTVIPIDLATDVVQLHKYLFEDESYMVSNTVQAISDAVQKKTGVDSRLKYMIQLSIIILLVQRELKGLNKKIKMLRMH